MSHADFSLLKGVLNVDGLCLRKIYSVKVSVVIIQNYLYNAQFYWKSDSFQTQACSFANGILYQQMVSWLAAAAGSLFHY
jgi:hypothetical protein